jgi:hypothetical protein
MQQLEVACKLTAYFPDGSPMEGPPVDRVGNPLHSVSQFALGMVNDISVAADILINLPYKTPIRIPALESLFDRPPTFLLVDTGAHFSGRGLTALDVCVGSQADTILDVFNQLVTIIVEVPDYVPIPSVH